MRGCSAPSGEIVRYWKALHESLSPHQMYRFVGCMAGERSLILKLLDSALEHSISAQGWTPFEQVEYPRASE